MNPAKGMLTLDDLRALAEPGQVDTVLHRLAERGQVGRVRQGGVQPGPARDRVPLRRSSVHL